MSISRREFLRLGAAGTPPAEDPACVDCQIGASALRAVKNV